MEETVLTQAIEAINRQIAYYKRPDNDVTSCADVKVAECEMIKLWLISLLSKEREQTETFGYNILSLTGCLNGNDDSFLNNLFNNNFTQYKPTEDGK